ncbi:MAG: chloride channel protein [Phycisphaerales bacterium]|nr:chloride channel protein [Phycisphaerales bacterium]
MTTSPTSPARSLAARLRLGEDWRWIVVGGVIGVLTGLGAIGFVTALHWLEHFSREGQQAWPLVLLPLIPMAGALATGLLVHIFASDARGHGVPQVIRAVVKGGGIIPLRVGITKVVASICTVGTGGSAGAEGPIVQIGATIGSAIGRLSRAVREHQNTFVGCGAAAGISSVFNAPIAGVFFVLEVILRDFSLRTFTPIVVASVLSAATTQVVLGADEAIFAAMPGAYAFSVLELPAFVALGLACGAVSVAFSRLLHLAEDLFARVKVHPAFKPVIGAFLLGLLGIAYALVVRRAGGDSQVPAFFGNGYDVIRWLIDPASYLGAPGQAAEGPSALPGLSLGFGLAVVLLVCKLFGTVFTLSTGGSGGVFAPSLFLGAAAGAAVGHALAHLGLLTDGASPATFALVGMGAVIAGASFAPLTAILLLFELTREPRVLLPIMLAAVIATLSARLLMRDSIYTHTLRRAGVVLGWTGDLAAMRRISLTSCRLSPLPREPIYPADPLSKLIALSASHDLADFPVVDQSSGAYLGMVTARDIRTALIDREAVPLLLVAELMRTDLPVVPLDASLEAAMDVFARFDVSSLVVTESADARTPVSLITRTSALKRYRDALEET